MWYIIWLSTRQWQDINHRVLSEFLSYSIRFDTKIIKISCTNSSLNIIPSAVHLYIWTMIIYINFRVKSSGFVQIKPSSKELSIHSYCAYLHKTKIFRGWWLNLIAVLFHNRLKIVFDDARCVQRLYFKYSVTYP